MPPLTVMIKPVSGACNMRCRYCFYADEMAHRQTAVQPRMTIQQLEIVVRRVIRAAEGSVHFLLQGGEPTLIGLPFMEAMVKFQRMYNGQGLRITNAVQTNGYDLSDEMIAFFAREQFLVGVSLDGRDETHNLLRVDQQGQPTASRVRQTLQRLQAAGVSVNVLCVVNEAVAKEPEAAFAALAPYGYMQFIPCLDGLDGQPRAYSLRSESYLTFLKKTYALYERAYREGEPVSVRSFDNWIGMLAGMPPESCAMAGQCGLSLMIESDGSVYPCDFYGLDEWRLGNITQEPLRRMLNSQRLKAFIAASKPVPQGCRSCRWYGLCRNGCRRERDTGTGVNRWCEAHAAFLEEAYPSMLQLAEAVRRQNGNG